VRRMCFYLLLIREHEFPNCRTSNKITLKYQIPEASYYSNFSLKEEYFMYDASVRKTMKMILYK